MLTQTLQIILAHGARRVSSLIRQSPNVLCRSLGRQSNLVNIENTKRIRVNWAFALIVVSFGDSIFQPEMARANELSLSSQRPPGYQPVGLGIAGDQIATPAFGSTQLENKPLLGAEGLPLTNPLSGSQQINLPSVSSQSFVQTDSPPTCADQLRKAKLTCRTLEFGGDDPGSAVIIGAMVSQITSAAAMVATAGKDPKRQCEIQGDINKWMGTLSAAKGAACAYMMRSCKQTCDQEAEANQQSDQAAARVARTSSKTCSTFMVDVYQMGTQFLASVPGYLANRNCAADFGANSGSGDIPDWAKPVGDCNDPRNMSLGCQCLRPEGAAKSECQTLKGLPGYEHLAGGGAGSTLGGPGSLAGANALGLAGALPPLPGDEAPGLEPGKPNPGQPGQQGMPMGAVGGGIGGQGGGLQGLGGDGGGYGPLNDPKSVITGQNNANGGGASSGGGGAGFAGAGGAGSGRSGGSDGMDSLLERFNLKSLLPKAKVVNRGIAGMSVKSVDGITGPTGPSIFEKATNQYRLQMQKQNVLLDP